ncbi:MAG: glycoside hydrolase family 88 protein [Verrucomicrobia bacterium]|jgi:rhamnogalacturonyl hydrolase YesR|nr:glycoside hydrolase family 88 protein [Verrucomicrobiota bacterium]
MAALIPLAGYSQAPAASALKTGDPFSPEVIATLMRKVNEYQAGHPVMKGSNRNWERGTWYTGVMAAGQATGDDSYIDQAMRWGEEHKWQPGTERSGGNVLTCTQTYLELYFLKTNHTLIEPLIQWVNSGRSNTPSGAKVWYLEGGVRYADSLYVGAPPLAMLAKATGDPKYLDWMNAFFWDVHAEIFDTADGLFYRDKRFIGKTSANGKKVFWSRGNGWAFGSLPRILSCLPANDPSRPKYEALFKQMAAAIAKQQQPDGLWRPNLGDAEEFAMPETSGTGFFCYGMAWGIRNDLLDHDTYLPVVKKAWAGLASCVSPEGRIRWGQLVGDRPPPSSRSIRTST